MIRGKVQRNEAKINALASKKEIVPGWPLKGTPEFAKPASTETTTGATGDTTTATDTTTTTPAQRASRVLEEESIFTANKAPRTLETTTTTTTSAILIEAITAVVEGEKELPAYTPPDSIKLETISFEDTKSDELSEIQMESDMRAEEIKLKAREEGFVAKEIEMLLALSNYQTTNVSDIPKYFDGDYLILMDTIKTQNAEKFGELDALRVSTAATFNAVFTEFKKAHVLFARLNVTFNHYKAFENNIYQYYYDPTVTIKPPLKDADWKALFVQFTFDADDSSKTYDEAVPFIYEDLRKLLQDQFRLGRTKFEEALKLAFSTLAIAENTRITEIEKYYTLSRANKIKRELYVNSNEVIIKASILTAATKIVALRTDVNNESLAGGTTARIAKGEEMFSLDMLYRVMKKIETLLAAWKVQLAADTDVDLWSPVMTAAAKRSFNGFRLKMAWMENSVAQLMLDITKPGYETGYQSDTLIYKMQRTELDLINANMLMNVIRIKDNRDKCFQAQYKVIAGITCTLLAGNGDTYFKLEDPPVVPPEKVQSVSLQKSLI